MVLSPKNEYFTLQVLQKHAKHKHLTLKKTPRVSARGVVNFTGFGQKLTFIGHQFQRMLQHRNIGAGFMRIFAQVATPLASARIP